jgi:hypothetical protein
VITFVLTTSPSPQMFWIGLMIRKRHKVSLNFSFVFCFLFFFVLDFCFNFHPPQFRLGEEHNSCIHRALNERLLKVKKTSSIFATRSLEEKQKHLVIINYLNLIFRANKKSKIGETSILDRVRFGDNYLNLIRLNWGLELKVFKYISSAVGIYEAPGHKLLKANHSL